MTGYGLGNRFQFRKDKANYYISKLWKNEKDVEKSQNFLFNKDKELISAFKINKLKPTIFLKVFEK